MKELEPLRRIRIWLRNHVAARILQKTTKKTTFGFPI
jgi:hypothetical protein